MINPVMAIIFESLAFSLAAVFVMNKIAKHASVGIGAGVLAGLMSAIVFVYFAVYVMHAPLFERIGVSSAGEFIASSGIVQAAFWGIFLPLGYMVGEKLSAKTFPVLTSRPLYYATSTAVIVLCWGISAIAKITGL